MFGSIKKPKIDTDLVKINELLTRGVEEIFIRKNLEEKLKSGKQLRVKLGIDPTGPKIHIGRAIVLRKLRAFQDLGHKIVLIVGDFTARIGDSSDKLDKRPMLSEKNIKENLENYKEQVGKVINLRNTEFHYNSRWLYKLGFAEISELAESFSVQQMSSRRNFKDRLEKGDEISLREFLYPLMQGYDSVAVKADVELGGFDQLFNIKAGRIIQKHYGQKEQDILATQMLEGTDGRKMSTSWGNVINITDDSSDMFGKVMSIRDELITKYFLLCTNVSEQEIENMKKNMEEGANPRDFKIRLAKEIVNIYHSQSEAQKAAENFENTFKKGGIPDDLKEVKITKGAFLVDVLLSQKLVESKSEFRRLVGEGAVTDMNSGQKISDPHFSISGTSVYKIGAKRFIKITVNE